MTKSHDEEEQLTPLLPKHSQPDESITFGSEHIYCWKNPPGIALKIWHHVHKDKFTISVILIAALLATFTFAVSTEEEENSYELYGVSQAYPLVPSSYLNSILFILLISSNNILIID